MSIVINYDDSKKEFTVPLGFKKIGKDIELNEARKLGEICFIFVSQEKILGINRSYLKHDYVTDVITFNYNVRHTISGDIYICIEKVWENAFMLHLQFSEELKRVMIHGLLHLIGYSDDNEVSLEEMREREDFYLDLIAKRGLWNEKSGL